MTSAPMQLATLEWGKGTGSRVLLLHGLTSSARSWWRVGAEIARAGHTVAAPDLRGHGNSARGDDCLLASYTADVLALGGDWDLVVGHCLGGSIAALARATSDRFARRLLLEDPLLRVADPDGFIAEHTRPFEDASARAILALNPGWHPQDARLQADALEASSPEVVAATVSQSLPWDLVSTVAGLDCPTLILGGDAGRGGRLDRATGSRIATLNPQVAFRVIEGAGHWIHRDSYGAFWDALRPLLRPAPRDLGHMKA